MVFFSSLNQRYDIILIWTVFSGDRCGPRREIFYERSKFYQKKNKSHLKLKATVKNLLMHYACSGLCLLKIKFKYKFSNSKINFIYIYLYRERKKEKSQSRYILNRFHFSKVICIFKHICMQGLLCMFLLYKKNCRLQMTCIYLR